MEEVKKFAEAVQPDWAVMEPGLTVRSEADYDRAVVRLNELLDEVGDDTMHPLYGLLDALGALVHAYEVEKAMNLAMIEISTDRSRLDVGYIHRYLSEQSYWAVGRSRDVVEKSLANSLCFGVYAGARQVGFARVVTDYATFAWLCDLFIDEAYRGQGLGKRLIEAVVAHPALQGLRNFILATRDAHELYRRYGGFEPLAAPANWMARPRK